MASTNDDQLGSLASRLEETATRIADERDVMKRIADAVVGAVRQRFDADDFAPLAASTLARRQKEGKDDRPLLDTLALYDAATTEVEGTTGSEFEVGDRTVAVGSDLPGAEEAEYGTEHEPARPWLPDPDEIVAAIGRSGALEAYLSAALGTDWSAGA